MNKLKITKDQKEKLKEFEWHTTSKEHAFELYKNKNPLYYGVLTLYNNFTPEQFALLLCGWYEVKEEYKVGDWIFRFNNYSQITKVENDNGKIKVFTDKHDGYLYEDEFRKATAEEIAIEEERRFWSDLGRSVGEYMEGDIVKGEGYLTSLWRLGVYKKRLNPSVIQIEDISDGSTWDVVKPRLVTPVEDRLDLE